MQYNIFADAQELFLSYLFLFLKIKEEQTCQYCEFLRF